MDAHDWYQEADAIWQERHSESIDTYVAPDGYWLTCMTPLAWVEELELRIRLEG